MAADDATGDLSMETITVSIDLKITFRQISDGWWEAISNYGMATGTTKEDCTRILTERVRRGY